MGGAPLWARLLSVGSVVQVVIVAARHRERTVSTFPAMSSFEAKHHFCAINFASFETVYISEDGMLFSGGTHEERYMKTGVHGSVTVVIVMV